MLQDVEESNQATNRNSFQSSKTKLKRLNRSAGKSLDVSATVNLIQESKECRICLDNNESNENQLLAPCKCIGSVKYVHDNCYRKWIERQFNQKPIKEQQKFLRDGVECELCKTKLTLLFRFRYSCCQTNKLSQKVKQNPIVFILFIIFFCINFGCIGYLTYNTITNPLNFSKSLVISMIIIFGYIFLGITAIVSIYHFLFDFFIIRVWVLESYKQKIKQNTRYSRNSVIPLDAQG